ncbi:MAG: 1,2-phenylacetyl-CoA epoxidase subunit PaaE [Pseudomonadota bacterium]
MSTQFNELKVSKVERLTENAVAISFDVPEDLKHEYTFQPGQYLTLRTEINGEDIRRSYSICAPLDQDLRVGIKQVNRGRFSTFAQDLQTGDALQVMPPEGRFVCEPDASGGNSYLLIAAGSGITPILSIARSVLEKEANSIVTLAYGNRATASIMFRQELEDLKDRFLERFHMYHVLSREAQDVELFHGRIDVERISEMTGKGIVDPEKADGIYLCGPAEMSLALAGHFKNAGIDETKIHTELFEAPGENKPVVISEETRKAVEDGVDVEVVLDGITRKFVLSDEQDTVLHAAEKSGLDLPFSCAGGMCATCRCKVVEGEAAMDKNFSLDDWELEAGFVLACQSRPKTERLVLDFDAT